MGLFHDETGFSKYGMCMSAIDYVETMQVGVNNEEPLRTRRQGDERETFQCQTMILPTRLKYKMTFVMASPLGG